MSCEKCLDKGFIEHNSGTTCVLCDCDKAKEVAGKYNLPFVIPKADIVQEDIVQEDNPSHLILSERMGDGETLDELAEKAREIIKKSKGSKSTRKPRK